jgi:hypothetical protein
MITKFKTFEIYSGVGKAIGFRYSNPKENLEANTYKSVISVDSIPSKEFRINLTTATKSIGLEDAEYKIIDEVITITFYAFSEDEAKSIHEEFLEFVKSSGYKIEDSFLSTPPTVKSKPGFKISREIPDKDPEVSDNKTLPGYTHLTQPSKTLTEPVVNPIGFKNYNK